MQLPQCQLHAFKCVCDASQWTHLDNTCVCFANSPEIIRSNVQPMTLIFRKASAKGSSDKPALFLRFMKYSSASPLLDEFCQWRMAISSRTGAISTRGIHSLDLSIIHPFIHLLILSINHSLIYSSIHSITK